MTDTNIILLGLEAVDFARTHGLHVFVQLTGAEQSVHHLELAQEVATANPDRVVLILNRPLEFTRKIDASEWHHRPMGEDEHQLRCNVANDWLVEHQGVGLSIRFENVKNFLHSGTFKITDGGELSLGQQVGDKPVPSDVEFLLREAMNHARAHVFEGVKG